MAWRRYEVVRKQPESATITSFYFRPLDGAPLTPFKPGQFLTFRFADASGRQVLRNYSLSHAPGQGAHYRISVKREPAPAGLANVPPGFASGRLHDQVAVGDELEIADPSGQFFLREDSHRTVLLISGGVGLTPMMAMAHHLADDATRRCWFVHACESGDVHAFRDEVDALVRRSPNLRRYFCYNRPTPADRARAAFDGEGLLTAERLQSFLPIDDYECYLCGPPPFMQALYGMLVRLGVPERQIHYEFFGPATLLKPAAPVTPASTPEPSDAELPEPSGEGSLVTFARSGVQARWRGGFESILDLAEAHGLSPDFSCRAGICATCQCDLVSGAVDYDEEPLAEPEPSTVLLCCSRPRGDVVIDA